MNQGILEVVKQEMARMNIDIVICKKYVFGHLDDQNIFHIYIYIYIYTHTHTHTHTHIHTAAAKSLQSCPTLCNPIDGSPPGSPVPGILQARTLEWVAISFSNA